MSKEWKLVIKRSTCATCKHWEQSSGHCLLATSDSGRPLCADSLAVAEDAESYRAWLATKPDFGCVMYEARVEEGKE